MSGAGGLAGSKHGAQFRAIGLKTSGSTDLELLQAARACVQRSERAYVRIGLRNLSDDVIISFSSCLLVSQEERRVFQTRQQLSRSDRQGGSGGGVPGANFAPGYVPPGFSPAATNAAQRPGASAPSSTKTRHRNRGANKKERAAGTGEAGGDAVEALCAGLQNMTVGGVSESPGRTQEGTQERSGIDTLRKK